ncbi:hypothetical protein FACS1894204_12300 [Synergistales bacterium]|nr:hypothetical protein FACS1894204_12300 [Synergistales bacterium]
MADEAMTVYLPFKDGSAVSYDGEKFTIHKRPVDIDAYLDDLQEGVSVRMWRTRRADLVKALESAWWKRQEEKNEEKTKKIYQF